MSLRRIRRSVSPPALPIGPVRNSRGYIIPNEPILRYDIPKCPRRVSPPAGPKRSLKNADPTVRSESPTYSTLAKFPHLARLSAVAPSGANQSRASSVPRSPISRRSQSPPTSSGLKSSGGMLTSSQASSQPVERRSSSVTSRHSVGGHRNRSLTPPTRENVSAMVAAVVGGPLLASIVNAHVASFSQTLERIQQGGQGVTPLRVPWPSTKAVSIERALRTFRHALTVCALALRQHRGFLARNPNLSTGKYCDQWEATINDIIACPTLRGDECRLSACRRHECGLVAIVTGDVSLGCQLVNAVDCALAEISGGSAAPHFDAPLLVRAASMRATRVAGGACSAKFRPQSASVSAAGNRARSVSPPSVFSLEPTATTFPRSAPRSVSPPPKKSIPAGFHGAPKVSTSTAPTRSQETATPPRQMTSTASSPLHVDQSGRPSPAVTYVGRKSQDGCRLSDVALGYAPVQRFLLELSLVNWLVSLGLVLDTSPTPLPANLHPCASPASARWVQIANMKEVPKFAAALEAVSPAWVGNSTRLTSSDANSVPLSLHSLLDHQTIRPFICNGVLLCDIIGVISGKRVVGTTRTPRTSNVCQKNVLKAIEAVRSDPTLSATVPLVYWTEQASTVDAVCAGDVNVIAPLLEDLHRAAHGVAPRSRFAAPGDVPYVNLPVDLLPQGPLKFQPRVHVTPPRKATSAAATPTDSNTAAAPRAASQQPVYEKLSRIASSRDVTPPRPIMPERTEDSVQRSDVGVSTGDIDKEWRKSNSGLHEKLTGLAGLWEEKNVPRARKFAPLPSSAPGLRSAIKVSSMPPDSGALDTSRTLPGKAPPRSSSLPPKRSPFSINPAKKVPVTRNVMPSMPLANFDEEEVTLPISIAQWFKDAMGSACPATDGPGWAISWSDGSALAIIVNRCEHSHVLPHTSPRVQDRLPPIAARRKLVDSVVNFLRKRHNICTSQQDMFITDGIVQAQTGPLVRLLKAIRHAYRRCNVGRILQKSSSTTLNDAVCLPASALLMSPPTFSAPPTKRTSSVRNSAARERSASYSRPSEIVKNPHSARRAIVISPKASDMISPSPFPSSTVGSPPSFPCGTLQSPSPASKAPSVSLPPSASLQSPAESRLGLVSDANARAAARLLSQIEALTGGLPIQPILAVSPRNSSCHHSHDDMGQSKTETVDSFLQRLSPKQNRSTWSEDGITRGALDLSTASTVLEPAEAQKYLFQPMEGPLHRENEVRSAGADSKTATQVQAAARVPLSPKPANFVMA